MAGFAGLVRAEAKDNGDDDKVHLEDLTASDHLDGDEKDDDNEAGMPEVKVAEAAGLFEDSSHRILPNAQKRSKAGAEGPRPPRHRFD